MKKYAPYILILIILVGLFSPMMQVNADPGENPDGEDTSAPPATTSAPAATPASTTASTSAPTTDSTTTTTTTVKNPDGTTSTVTTSGPSSSKDAQKGEIVGCSIFSWSGIEKCLYNIFYLYLFGVADLLLYVSAQFFNVMIGISINNVAVGLSGFVSDAWVVVRDLSNIFFILILLYIAIKLILGLGGSEVKKMIAHVIIMALLINFSLFFTKVVIDSSNILALVFYNKLKVDETRPYPGLTPYGDKDIGGEIYFRFSGLTTLTDGTFEQKLEKENGVALSILLKLGILVVSGLIVAWASYTFFVASFMFLGRLIELWVLMIFSPFAFMSFALPKLADIPYIGWRDWSKKLIAASFMAPIFMFFLYLIFKLMDSGIFDSLIKKDNGGAIATILGALIPAALIITLLRKAVDIAKKGGGAFGEKFAKGIEVVGGLATTAAIGAASGGAALALRAGVTAGAGKLATMSAEPNSRLARFSGKLKDFESFTRKRSFDFRAAPEGVKSLMSKSNIFAVQKGGLEGIEERQTQKRLRRADELEKRGTKDAKKNVELSEINLKEALLPQKQILEKIDEDIKKARTNLNDAKNGGDPEEIQAAKDKLDNANNKKAAIRGAEYNYKDPTTGVKYTVKKKEGGIADLEDKVRDRKYELYAKSSEIREAEASRLENLSTTSKITNTLFSFGAYSPSTEKGAARKIRLGEKSGGEKKEKDEEKDHDKKEERAEAKKEESKSENDSGGDKGKGSPHA